MAELEDLQGTQKLREAWPIIERNEQAINGDIINHKASGAAHAAESITYSGPVAGAANIKQAVDSHVQSEAAHAAEHITYAGAVVGAANIQEAVDFVDERLDTIIVGGSEDKDPELTDIKTPDPSYTPGRTIAAAGDLVRDMQKQFGEQLAEMVTNVKTFGAIGDGQSHPLSEFFPTLATAQMKFPNATSLTNEVDELAIQAAIDYCFDSGGGTVLLPAGTYVLGTVHGVNSALIYAKSKVNISGVGSASVLLVKGGLNDPGKYFNVIGVPTRLLVDAVSDCIFKDFVIDCNGVNNLIPVGEYAKENNGIQLWHGQNIIIDNVDMRNNPGLQCIRLGTDTEHDFKKVRIKNCNFEDVGTAVPGNVNQIDHSTIYFSGSDLIIDNCIFSNKIRPINNATCAIEIHSDTTIVVNCIIDNYSVGIITAAETADIFDVRYSNNIMKRMTTGFQFWLTSAVSMRDIVLDNNTVESLYSIGNAVDCGQMNYPGENIALRGNTFKCTDNITANVANGISIRNFKNIVIDGDVVKGFMADGIMVEPINGVTNLQILNTGIEDCGRSTVIGENYGISLVSGNKFNIVSINHNRIKNTGTQYMRNGIVSNCDAVSYDFLGNEVTNIPLDPGGLSRDITLTAILTGSVRIEHTGNGSPLNFIKASIGSKWVDRVNRVRYIKNAGDNLISGWVNERGIYDSGSNANGHYIMFDDGTMECYHTKFVSSLAINTAIGSMFMSGDATWTFPVPFAVITCSPDVVPAYAGLYAWGSVQGGSLSALAFRIISPVALTSAVDIRLKAVGRWK